MNEEAFDRIQKMGRELAIRKNKDYGNNNISKFGLTGVVVRLSDKIERLIQLVMTDKTVSCKDEKLEDTLIDIANYGIIGYMVLKGEWNDETKDNDNTDKI